MAETKDKRIKHEDGSISFYAYTVTEKGGCFYVHTEETIRKMAEQKTPTGLSRIAWKVTATRI